MSDDLRLGVDAPTVMFVRSHWTLQDPVLDSVFRWVFASPDGGRHRWNQPPPLPWVTWHPSVIVSNPSPTPFRGRHACTCDTCRIESRFVSIVEASQVLNELFERVW